MRPALLSAPVNAAAGVAVRSFQATNPSRALRPRAQIATAGAFEEYKRACDTTLIAV
jgi:hypothetical protein